MLKLPGVFVVLTLSLLFACNADRETSGKTVAALQPARPVASAQFGRSPCADDPRVGRVGFPGTPPVLITKVEPSMERIAPAVRGVVVLEIIIDPQGVPCSVAVLRSLRSDADEAAVTALKQWRFIPAKLNGEGWHVAYNVTIAVDK